jgi:hypothetical protein
MASSDRDALFDQDELGIAIFACDLRVEERLRPGHGCNAGLDPGVASVDSLARSANSDPPCDMARIDRRRACEQDRRPDAVTTVRSLMPCIRISAGARPADAGALGRCVLGGADERDDTERTDDEREEGPHAHACVVDGRCGRSYPSF